jgi:ABC-2 type transport system permease protein
MSGRTINQALLIAGKDLKLMAADRMALMLMLVFPLVFVGAFGAMFAGQQEDPAYAVHLATHEGPGSVSQMIIDAMKAGDARLEARQVSPADARQAVLDNKLSGYLEFPADFSSAIREGRRTGIAVFTGPDAQDARFALASIAESIAAEVGRRWVRQHATVELAVSIAGPGIAPEVTKLLSAGQSTGRGGGGQVAIDYAAVGDGRGKAASTYILPGYVTMFVFFALALSAEALVGERDNHTLDRLIASRASRGAILLGKYLGNVARGTVQAAVLWTAGALIFRADLGYAPLATFAVSFGIVLCAAALGLAMATVARTRQAASSIAVFGSLIMAPLGGCWWPLWLMPPWMQALARVTPHAWANAAFSKLLLFAAPPGSVVTEVLVLLAFAAGFGALAAAKFRVEH